MEASSGGLRLSGSATIEFKTYPQRLIELAERLLREEEFGMAVVVAHVAAEVAASRALTKAFEGRRITDLEEAVTGLFSGSSLGNDRIRRLYTAMSGDDIAAQPFWSDFARSARTRNEITHQGATGKRDEAEMAIRAVTAVVKHLGQWGRTA